MEVNNDMKEEMKTANDRCNRWLKSRLIQYQIEIEIMKKTSYKYFTNKKINKIQKYILRIMGIKFWLEEKPEKYEEIEIKEVSVYK